ncbi:uncharacterized protein LOC121383350 [Gigantopelta aegis]|uniref:uncharacterized protein LOC121383350 n=1 Tax=Gigantopelta aegis TaxID=1735272 RepID=UPI001B88E1C7|nr:uncharacterized protein LOC121383350 [Gigantopelta aegis]
MGHFCQLYTILVSCLIGIVHDQSVEPDYDNIEYGGVWKSVISGASVKDKDLDGAVQCALLYLKKSFLNDIVQNKDLWDSYKVGNVRKLKLIYTRDERSPFHPMVLETVGENKVFKPVPDPVVFGMTYSFYLEWHHNFNVEKHSFTVTMYPIWKYYIYSHTSENPILFSPLNFITNISTSNSIKTASSSAYVSLELDISADGSYVTRNFTAVKAEFQKDTCPKPEVFSNAEMNEGNNKHCKMERLQHQLSVMSYNIWNFNSFPNLEGDVFYQARIKHLTKVVIEHQPDIIVFQEVRFETGRGGKLGPSQVQHLSKMLPAYQFVYHPAQVMDTSLKNGRTEEGLAIFSRYPIIHHDFILLFRNQSNSADLHQRLCQHVEVHIAGVVQPVHIFNTHLSLSHEAREQSVTQIWDYIQTHKGVAILAGDFNSEPQEKSIQILSETTSLTDVWTYIHGNKSPGFTFSTLNDALNKRIDYIYIRRQAGIEILDGTVLDDAKKREEAASDHVPVMATIGIS